MDLHFFQIFYSRREFYITIEYKWDSTEKNRKIRRKQENTGNDKNRLAIAEYKEWLQQDLLEDKK